MYKLSLFIILLSAIAGLSNCKKEEANKNEPILPASFVLEEPSVMSKAINMVRRSDGRFVILSYKPSLNFSNPFLQLKEFEINGSSPSPVIREKLVSMGAPSNLFSGADLIFDETTNRTFFTFSINFDADTNTTFVTGSVSTNFDISSSNNSYSNKLEISKIIISGNGFIIVGSKTINNNRNVFVRKIDNLFNKVWEKTYGGAADDMGIDAVQLCDGNIGILAHTYSYGAGDRDVWFLKINQQGDSLSSHFFGGAEYEEPQQIVADERCRYYIAAHSSSFGHPEHNGYIVCVDDNGNKIWENNYGTVNHDGFNAIALLPDKKGVIAAGRSMIAFGGQEDIYVQAVDFSGTPLWRKIYGHATKSENSIAIATDSEFYYLLVNRTLGTQNEAVFVVDKLE